MGAHEALEHAEHAGHAHGSKQMGVTMAVLGVLIALSAAMVGSQRQELMTALLDQSWAHSSWVAASVESSMVASDLQKLHGQPGAPATPYPSPTEVPSTPAPASAAMEPSRRRDRTSLIGVQFILPGSIWLGTRESTP